ncbi:hypothetical protein ACROYT_G034669 [Oculina patagonica]
MIDSVNRMPFLPAASESKEHIPSTRQACPFYYLSNSSSFRLRALAIIFPATRGVSRCFLLFQLSGSASWKQDLMVKSEMKRRAKSSVRCVHFIASARRTAQ